MAAWAARCTGPDSQMIEVEVGAIMRLLLPSDRPCPLSLALSHLEDLEMAKQSFDGWQTAAACWDFPLPGVGNAAGEPDGTGNLGGEGESDRSDWDRFFAYCDRVIVAALGASQSSQPIRRIATRRSGSSSWPRECRGFAAAAWPPG